MKKYIVLSVNENPEYLFYLPLTVWAWRKFGWEPIVFVSDNWSPVFKFVKEKCHDVNFYSWNDAWLRNPYSDYNSETIAQISRLYAACCSFSEHDYLMTGDIDMIPLSDYWKFKYDEITVWGRDLTDYHYPICYIGMNTKNWIKVMNLNYAGGKPYQYNELMKRDLKSLPNAQRCDDPVKRWVVDQDLITERLNNCGMPITRIDRGMYSNGYPIGRIDRSAWTLGHDKFIDCHMLRGIWKDHHNKEKTMGLLHKIWPEEDFKWFEEYIEKFKQLQK